MQACIQCVGLWHVMRCNWSIQGKPKDWPFRQIREWVYSCDLIAINLIVINVKNYCKASKNVICTVCGAIEKPKPKLQWQQPVASHASYPTDSHAASRFGLCNSLAGRGAVQCLLRAKVGAERVVWPPRDRGPDGVYTTLRATWTKNSLQVGNITS